MRTIALTLSLLLSACTGSGCSRFPPPPVVAPCATVAAQVAATVAVHATDPETGSGGTGTAWLAAQDDRLAYWVTAGHVCEPEAIMTLGEGAEALFAVQLAVSADPDLCLLASKPVPVEPLALAAQEPAVGDPVRYVGNPLGVMSQGMTPIFFGHYSGNRDGTSFLSIPGYPGASGSAVLDDQGHVIGVLYAVARSWQELAFICDLQALRTFLGEHVPAA